MHKFESSEKRQAFRLQIRDKQIKQKLSCIRSSYSMEQQQISNPLQFLYLHYPEQIKNVVSLLTQFLHQLAQCLSQQSYQLIGCKFDEMMKCIDQNVRSIEIDCRLGRQGKGQAGGLDLYGQVITLCANEMLLRDGEMVVDLVRKEGRLDAGDDEEREEGDWREEEEEKQYREFCQSGKDRMNTIHEINENTRSQAQNQPSNQAQPVRQTQKQMPYELQLLLLKKLLQFLCQVQPAHLHMQPSLHILLVIWQLFKKVPVPPSSPLSIEQQEQQQMYLGVVQGMLDIFNAFVERTGLGWELRRDFLVELAVFEDVRYIVDYVVEVGKARGHKLDFTAMVKLHTSILQLLRHHEKGQSTILTANSNQYLTSYCLYILSLPILPHSILAQSSGSMARLYQHTLYLLCQLLGADIEMGSFIDPHHYETMLQIMKIYGQGAWDRDTELIVFGVLRVVNLAVDQCELMASKMIDIGVLDYAQAILRKVVGLMEGEDNGSADTASLNAIVKQLSSLLQRLPVIHSKSLKKLTTNHGIWQYIFSILDSRLLPLYWVFPNYFLCCGRSTTLNKLHILLDCTTRLPTEDRESKELADSLLYEVYTNCQCYLSQEEMGRVGALYQMYGVDVDSWDCHID